MVANFPLMSTPADEVALAFDKYVRNPEGAGTCARVLERDGKFAQAYGHYAMHFIYLSIRINTLLMDRRTLTNPDDIRVTNWAIDKLYMARYNTRVSLLRCKKIEAMGRRNKNNSRVVPMDIG